MERLLFSLAVKWHKFLGPKIDKKVINSYRAYQMSDFCENCNPHFSYHTTGAVGNVWLIFDLQKHVNWLRKLTFKRLFINFKNGGLLYAQTGSLSIQFCMYYKVVTVSGTREQWLHRHSGSHCVVTVPSTCRWLWWNKSFAVYKDELTMAELGFGFFQNSGLSCTARWLKRQISLHNKRYIQLSQLRPCTGEVQTCHEYETCLLLCCDHIML